MGSYYGTCGVTNLPIEDGDEVVLFVLENALAVSLPDCNMCYCDTLYYPVSPPIRATYEDYGDFAPQGNEGQKNAEIFLKDLERAAPKIGKISWDAFGELLREGATVPGTENSKKGAARVEKQLYLFPVMAAVYEKMTQYAFKNKDFQRRMGFRFDDAMRDASFQRKSLRKIVDPEWDRDNREFAKQCSRMFTRSDVPNISSFEWHAGVAAESFLAKGEETTIEDVSATAKEFLAFKFAMDDLRKSFAPLSGGGSQTLAYDLHAEIGRIAIDKHKKFIEEYGDDKEIEEQANLPRPGM